MDCIEMAPSAVNGFKHPVLAKEHGKSPVGAFLRVPAIQPS